MTIIYPELDVSTPNVLRFRKLSKAYGLAGMRIGAVFGAQTAVQAFNKVRNPAHPNPPQSFVIPDKRSADPEPMPWTVMKQFWCGKKHPKIATKLPIFLIRKVA
jgi:hypothetical protein